MDAPTRFGRELKRLIARDYATETEFGKRVSLSQGRVSQLVRERPGKVTYATLETVLSGFDSVADQEALYQAWLESHAPSPTAQGFSEEWDEDKALSYIADSPRLLERGQHQNVAKTLTGMWQYYSQRPKLYRLALATGEALQDMWSCTSRHAKVVSAARETLDLAVRHGDRGWQIRSVWREGLAVRPFDSEAQARPGSGYESAKEMALDWRPQSAEGKEQRADIVASVIRDRAALASTLFRHGTVGTEFVAARLSNLQRSLEEPPSVHHLILGKEVEARLLADLRRTEDALDSIAVAEGYLNTNDLTAKVKLGVTRVRALILERELGLAERVLADTLQLAENGRMLPYCLKLTNYEVQLSAS